MKHFDLKSKVLTIDQVLKQLLVWRLKDDVIVFTNGCFDILHEGHINYLHEASMLGNRLIIGVNSDDSVRRLKGNERPVNGQSSRALMLAALHFTDAVILFEEDTPIHLIHQIKPDILVKGADYEENEIVGGEFVKSYGGKIARIPLSEGFSSTGIIEKIRKS